MVPMSLALSVHRTRSTRVSLMPFWWRARLMADVTLAVSLGVRRDTPACTNSKVRWSMVGCGLATEFFFEALLAFLLWATFHSLAEGAAATVVKDLLWGGGGGAEVAGGGDRRGVSGVWVAAWGGGRGGDGGGGGGGGVGPSGMGISLDTAGVGGGRGVAGLTLGARAC